MICLTWKLRSRSLTIDDSRPVVMMVEDNPEHREIYGTILWYNGFNVFLVPDGTSALRAVSFLQPDLILLDLALPDAKGLEICDPLRKLRDGQEIPVIALSAFPAAEMEGQAYAAGCRHYLEKGATTPLDALHIVEGILGRPPASGDGATPWMLSYPTSDESASV